MMRRIAVFGALVAIASIASGAQAQGITHACGGTDFFSCVTVGVTGTGTSSLTFSFTNVSNTAPANNPNSVFKLFGLSNTVVPVSISSTSSSFTTVCSVFVAGCGEVGKNFANTFQGAGLTGDFFGLNANHPAPTNGLKTDGQTASFTLVFSSAVNASNFLNGIDYALHDIGGLTDACGSSKADFGATGTPAAGSAHPSNAATCSPGTNTVPEPSSMALLGTGMVGLVPMLRRKRR